MEVDEFVHDANIQIEQTIQECNNLIENIEDQIF